MLLLQLNLFILLFVLRQTSSAQLDLDLNEPAIDSMNIDLNLPLEQHEESMTAPMKQTVQDSVPDQSRSTKPKRHRSKLKMKVYRDTFKAKLMTKPEDYEKFKTIKSQKAKDKYHNLNKAEKEELLLQKRLSYRKLMHSRKQQNPEYRKIDKRTQLRARIREGNPSEDDVRKHAELLKKDRIRDQNRKQAALNSAKKMPLVRTAPSNQPHS
ncbi:uncharacterized protein FA14DRAFT_158442 [Meira miltonrushii]|uniref:Uncharacterized protein n=1 Tax=Meira miltonrushii TaxID=1280837 RepID=A0A316V292_9BASI|nr:uncharacterized protein FA14DRAFT_158442 [Meira miltonrushii]PWN31630.1 hypothetical protein FA14DRAFT_158442 [Meira miltonrushii]